jgi:hypothetical protein
VTIRFSAAMNPATARPASILNLVFLRQQQYTRAETTVDARKNIHAASEHVHVIRGIDDEALNSVASSRIHSD